MLRAGSVEIGEDAGELTIMNDPNKTIEVTDDIEIEYQDDIKEDDPVVWIHDTGDASHPGTVCLYASEVPKLIEALQKVIEPPPKKQSPFWDFMDREGFPP